MNDQRRKQIQTIIDKLDKIKDEVEVLQYEEEAAYENTPESLRTTNNEMSGTDLGEAVTSLEELLEKLNSSINHQK